MCNWQQNLSHTSLQTTCPTTDLQQVSAQQNLAPYISSCFIKPRKSLLQIFFFLQTAKIQWLFVLICSAEIYSCCNRQQGTVRVKFYFPLFEQVDNINPLVSKVLLQVYLFDLLQYRREIYLFHFATDDFFGNGCYKKY